MESHDNYYAFLAGLESHDDWRVDSVDDTLSSSNENLGSFFLEDTQPEYVPCSANPPQALSGTNGSDVPDFPEHSFSSAPPAAAEYLAAEQLDDMCMWGNLEMGLNEDTLQGLSQPVPDAEVITPTTSIDTTWTPPWSDPASASPLAASDTTTQLSPAVSLPHPMTPATPSPHFQFHFDQATFHESSGGDGLMHQAADFQQPSEPELRPQSQAQSDIHMPNTAPPRTPMREKRKINKPEKCPFCRKGFPFMADRDKHIVAKHEELAYLVNVPVILYPCRHCPSLKPYKRSDHLRRHERNKHGRGKQKRGGRSA